MPGPRSSRFQHSRKGATLSAAPTTVPLLLLVSPWLMGSPLRKCLWPGKFNAFTDQTAVICAFLVVGCGVNSVKALRLRAGDPGSGSPEEKTMGTKKKKKKCSVAAIVFMTHVHDRATRRLESGGGSICLPL